MKDSSLGEYTIEEADATDGIDNKGGMMMAMRRGRGAGHEPRKGKTVWLALEGEQVMREWVLQIIKGMAME
jgi:hypothetical protein